MWQTKSEDREAAIYHSRLQHRVARQVRAKEFATKYLERSSEYYVAEVRTLTNKAQTNFLMVEQAVASIAKTHCIPPQDVRVLCVLNWAAPTLLTAEGQRQQASVAGAVVNKPESCNMGILLTPGHVNKKGQLWKEEEDSRMLVVNNNINSDLHFAMGFDGRNDARDQRTQISPAKKPQNPKPRNQKPQTLNP